MRVSTVRDGGIAMVLLVGLGACGGDDGPRLPKDQLVYRRAEVMCAKTFECCDSTEVAELMALFGFDCTTEECCVGRFESAYDFFHEGYEESVIAGRVSFSNDFVASCLQQIEAQSCADFGPNGVACTNLFTPLQTAGMPCADSYECASAYCEGADAVNAVDGTCQPEPGLGEPCPEWWCAAGSYCAGEQPGATCAARKADGEACTYDHECVSGACSEALQCTTGARCDGPA
jgi:hypothetical protein